MVLEEAASDISTRLTEESLPSFHLEVVEVAKDNVKVRFLDSPDNVTINVGGTEITYSASKTWSGRTVRLPLNIYSEVTHRPKATFGDKPPYDPVRLTSYFHGEKLQREEAIRKVHDEAMRIPDVNLEKLNLPRD